MMQDWLQARAQATPQRAAAILGDDVKCYAELDEIVDIWCYQLAAAGIAAGAHVGVLLNSGWGYVATVHALVRIGAVLVPLNIRLNPAEIRFQLEQAQCGYLICSEAYEQTAVEAAPDGVQVWSTDWTDRTSVQSLRDVEFEDDKPYPAYGIDMEQMQAIVFTSGTTGQPKGAQITFGNHFYSAMASTYRLGHQPDDRWLSVLPLYHVGGLAVLFRSALYGIATVLHPRFDMAVIQNSFDDQQITMISLVPTMLYRMIEAGVRFPDSLRLILLGGAAASPELLRQAFDMGLPIAPTYGLTEAASQVATMLPTDAKGKHGSVGKPLLFSGVRIVDEHGREQASGTYGEVIVSGKTVMKGYYNNPEATAKTIRNGELYTGDIGYLDAEGDLWLVQRRSDLIVTGGENVYPAEVEGVLRQHPAVKTVCIVGIDHPEWGQQVAAAVVLETDATLTTDALMAYIREQLAGYKRPRRIVFVDELPQTASGKVKRGAVTELFK